MSAAREPAVPPVPGPLIYRRDQRTRCKKLIVAVHGMGDQTRNEFVQDIARLFARHRPSAVQATHLPLGLWDAGGDDPVNDYAIGFVPTAEAQWLQPYAFAEMHWAHLPRQLENAGYRLEDPTRWVGSIVERLTQRYDLTPAFGENGPRIAATVLQEIGETVALLERLLWLPKLAGIFDFDLGRVIERTLGDVEQVADFKEQRRKFLRCFLERMDALDQQCPAAEIHFIAHSEGAALLFFTLLTALRRETDSQGLDLSWIDRVRSFSTLGCPIDKHLILFPEMWYHFSHHTTWHAPPNHIRWRNYYDFADPVGYDLDTARTQLAAWGCLAFEFEKQHDHGFRRYPLPGIAHLDYFKDDKLFRHLIQDAVEGLPADKAPGNTLLGWCSPVVPFLVVALLHLAAIFLLHGAVAGDALAGSHDWRGVAAGAALLLGTTVLARTLRLTKKFPVVALALLAYIAGAALFWWRAESAMGVWFVLASGLVVSIAVLVDHLAVVWWRKRPIGGLRAMLLLGTAAVALWLAGPGRGSIHAAGFGKLPLLSAAGAFYLWWLGALLYDLAFCWQRYINSTENLLCRIRPLPRRAPAHADDPDGQD